MTKDNFAGDKKDGVSILHPYEVRFKAFLLPFVPQGIETYHLTMLTVVWSILVIVFSWLATYNRQWLWGASLMVVAQYVSDLLDGAIGRQRNTGLVKWGFYMDHFLDYIFLCSILIGYSLLMPNSMKYWMFFIFAVIGAFLVNSFLQFAATNKFQIAYWGIGPTEGRIGFIVINALIIFVDRSDYVKTLPYVLAVAMFALFFTAYNTQRQLWKMDMEAKAEAEGQVVSETAFDGQGLIIRHFLVSFILASLAFLVLVAKLGGPFYKSLAGAIYGISWIPILVALVRYRRAGRSKYPQLKKYRPLVAAAIVMACCAWAGVKLMPPVEDPSIYLTPEYRSKLAEDAQAVIKLTNELETLLADQGFEVSDANVPVNPRLKPLCKDFMRCQSELMEIQERTKGVYLIDYQEEPGLHTDTFLVEFAAQAVQVQSLLAMMMLSHDTQVRTWLSQEDPSFDKELLHLFAPGTLLKLMSKSTYVMVLKNTIESSASPEEQRLRQQLRDIAKEHVDGYAQQLRKYPNLLKEIRLQVEQTFK